MKRLAVLCALLLLASCTERPTEAEFDNLLDPDGPGGGDPFALKVRFAGPDMELTWNDISEDFPDLSGYNFYRSSTPNVDAGDFVGSAPTDADGVVQASDPSFNRDAINYYKVAATRGNATSSVEAVQAASAYAPPTARLKNGRAITPQPLVELTLLPEVLNRGGDVFELSLSADFSSYDSFTDTGSDTPIALDLGPAPGEGHFFRFYSRVRYAGGTETSPVGVDSVATALNITIDVPQAVGGLRDTTVFLAIGDLTGVERMRVAFDEGDLDTAPWVIPDSSFVAFPVNLPVVDSLVVYGEFETTFGFAKRAQTGLLKAVTKIGPCSFFLANGDTITSTPEIDIERINAPGAAYMRFSEDPGFVGVGWVPVASIHPFTLSPSFGVKVVYGQFMNPFRPEAKDWGAFVDGIELAGGG